MQRNPNPNNNEDFLSSSVDDRSNLLASTLTHKVMVFFFLSQHSDAAFTRTSLYPRNVRHLDCVTQQYFCSIFIVIEAIYEHF